MAEEIYKLQLEKNLINAVKEYPEIYAKSDKNYENNLHDQMSWLGVSEKLRVSTIRCSNMWYSMLQTFLYFARLESKGMSAPEAMTWPHINAFKELQPLLVPNYVDMLTLKSNGKYHSTMKPALLDALLMEIELHSNELMNPILSHIRRQKIWSNIANKLNSLSMSTQLPVFLWQKVWWDLKRRARLRKQLEMKGVYVNSGGNLLAQDLRILQICGISQTENNRERIKEQLQSCVEIDGDVDSNACEKCSSLKMSDLSCEKCSSALDVCMCEICSKYRSSICCNISNWSAVAKRMIPLAYQTKNQILICTSCHTALKRNASLEWKVCRFCAQDNTNLENFSSNAYQEVLEILHSATRIKFSLEDGLPSYICLTCKAQLFGFGKLFSNFVSCQTKLRDVHAQLFIGETSSRKRTSTSKDLSNLAEANGVTASKQARPRSEASNTTLFSSAMESINLHETSTPANMGDITITKVSKTRNAAPSDLSQDQFVTNNANNAVQTNGSLIQLNPTVGMAQSNSNTSLMTSNEAMPNFLLSTSTSSNTQVTMVSRASPRIAGASSNDKSHSASSTTRPYRRKPCTPSSDTLNEPKWDTVIRNSLNYEQFNPLVLARNSIQTTATPPQAPRSIIPHAMLSELLNKPPIRINTFGSMQTAQLPSTVARGTKKPPQRRMTIHNLSQPATMETSLRNLVPAQPPNQTPVATGKSPAQFPSTVLKGSRKPPQRRLTVHSSAVPSPTDLVVANRSKVSQSDLQMRASSSSQAKSVTKNTATRYYVALKGGDSPPRRQTPTPKTPPRRRMTIHQLTAPNCTTYDTPQRAIQMTPTTRSRRYNVTPKDNKIKPSPAERPAPIRQRRQTIHNSLTPMSPKLRQPPRRVIETIVIRDDSPPREKAHPPKPSSSVTKKTAAKKPPARRKSVSSASTSRRLQRTPSPDIIIIPDDSPPRTSHQRNFDGWAPNGRTFRTDSSEPLLKTEIALRASLLIDDDDEAEPTSSQDLATPSGPINYAIQKAYNVSTPVPQRSRSTVTSSHQTATSNQEQQSSNRRSLRSSSKRTPPKTAEDRKAKYN